MVFAVFALLCAEASKELYIQISKLFNRTQQEGREFFVLQMNRLFILQ
jgi:hypothetical protein